MARGTIIGRPPAEAAERVGIRQVANRACVSTATVSRVLNDPDKVSGDVRRRVLDAISDLNYVPHSAARALSRLRTNTLGIIIPTMRSSIFAEQVEALQRLAEEHNYNLLIAVSDFSLDKEVEQARALAGNGVEGMMLVGSLHHKELYDLLAARRIFYVNTSTFEAAATRPCVGFDNVAAARRAANHLLELGHDRIALVSGVLAENDRAMQRLEGTRQALAERGVELPNDRVVEVPYTIRDGRRALRQLMSANPPPTAVIAGNDVLALGVVLEAHALRIPIPGRLSIVGFDDLEWAREIDPPLTTIRVAWAHMARLAGVYLLARLQGETGRLLQEIDADLVMRESTGRAP